MNQLKHIAEFQDILATYQLSTTAQDTLKQTRLVLLVGPTSSGRNTIISKLLETNGYHYIVSDTTREVRQKDGRPIEQNGREYWFRDEEAVLADLRDGDFLEAAIIHEQQVSGISIREIEKARQAGKIAITDVEPNGAETIHGLKPDTQILFVVPPNLTAWLERLHARSDLPEDEVRRRLEAACSEMQTALSRPYYVFVINDTLEHAVREVQEIVDGKIAEANPEARKVVEQLYNEACAYVGHDE